MSIRTWLIIHDLTRDKKSYSHPSPACADHETTLSLQSHATMKRLYHYNLLQSNYGAKVDSFKYQVTGQNNISKLCTPKDVF